MNNYYKNIKEKSDFIYLNSGLILSKLNSTYDAFDTENELQILLLYDSSLEELYDIRFKLLLKNCDIIYENNYQSAMEIIFHIARLIENTIYDEEGKIRLRDKIRIYAKYFECDEKELVKNKKYIKFTEKN